MVRAAYDRIYHDLREAIEDGTFAFGSLLPSQTELVAEFDCAHNTVRKALALLASQGYCQPIHGKGVRVIWRPVDGHTPFATGGFEEHGYGAPEGLANVTGRVLTFEVVKCDTWLAEFSGFVAGKELLHIERVRLIDGKPLISDDIYMPGQYANILSPEACCSSIHGYLKQTTNLRLITTKRIITVERTTPQDVERIDVAGIDFIPVATTCTFDGNAELFECAQSRYHPDHFRFHDTALRERP